MFRPFLALLMAPAIATGFAMSAHVQRTCCELASVWEHRRQQTLARPSRSDRSPDRCRGRSATRRIVSQRNVDEMIPAPEFDGLRSRRGSDRDPRFASASSVD